MGSGKAEEVITAITITRGRPEAFALLCGYVARQTVQPDQWIVVSDGCDGYTFPETAEVYEREWMDGDGIFSFGLNLTIGMHYVENNKVLFLEDDEFYHPKYIETMGTALDKYSLVGLRNNCYWRCRARTYIQLRNTAISCLATTGMTDELAPFAKKMLDQFQTQMDGGLWDNWNGTKILLSPDLPNGQRLNVGIKQMPGVSGAGLGHGDNGTADPQGHQLRKWIGSDYRAYMKLGEQC